MLILLEVVLIVIIFLILVFILVFLFALVYLIIGLALIDVVILNEFLYFFDFFGLWRNNIILKFFLIIVFRVIASIFNLYLIFFHNARFFFISICWKFLSRALLRLICNFILLNNFFNASALSIGWYMATRCCITNGSCSTTSADAHQALRLLFWRLTLWCRLANVVGPALPISWLDFWIFYGRSHRIRNRYRLCVLICMHLHVGWRCCASVTSLHGCTCYFILRLACITTLANFSALYRTFVRLLWIATLWYYGWFWLVFHNNVALLLIWSAIFARWARRWRVLDHTRGLIRILNWWRCSFLALGRHLA